jgi:hypothetical protein
MSSGIGDNLDELRHGDHDWRGKRALDVTCQKLALHDAT